MNINGLFLICVHLRNLRINNHGFFNPWPYTRFGIFNRPEAAINHGAAIRRSFRRSVPLTDIPPADSGRPAPRVPLKIEEALGAAAMAMICLISFGNVVVRYATSISFAFTEEVSVFLLVVMTFTGAGLAFATDRHIRITVVTARLGRTGRAVCEAVSLLATTILFSLILWYGALAALDGWRWGETSPGLGWPIWIYTGWLPVMAAAILLRVCGRAAARLRRPRGRRP